jgi:Xaa-Pro aminopeptidase
MATSRRLDLLRQKLAEQPCDGLLLVRHENVEHRNLRWASGFKGTSAFAVVTAEAAMLLTDGRYTVQARAQCTGWAVREHGRPVGPALAAAVAELGIRRLGYEPDALLVSTFREIEHALGGGVDLVATPALTDDLRACKDSAEIAAIRRACAIADGAFAKMLQHVAVGVTERELARHLDSAMLAAGAEGLAFPSIVAGGPNSALPHAQPSERPLQAGEFLVVDFGAQVDGYCGDMTRTVCVGQASAAQRTLYATVAAIQRAAVAAVRAGASADQLAAAARDAVAAAGFGDYPSHSLGHGIGLQIHEGPWLRVGSKDVLQPGQVVTVEPGIYVPELGGVRIEDALVVEEGGHAVLTGTARELLEIG